MLCPVGDDAYIVPFDALLRADVGIRPYDMAIVSFFDAKKGTLCLFYYVGNCCKKQ